MTDYNLLFEPHTLNVDSADFANRDHPQININPAIQNCELFYVDSVQIPFSYFVSDFTTNVLHFFMHVTSAGALQNNTKQYQVFLEAGTFTATNFPTMFQRVINNSYDSSKPYIGGTQSRTYNGSSWGSWSGDTSLGSGSGYQMTAFPYAGDSKITFYIANTSYSGLSTEYFYVDMTSTTESYTAAQWLGGSLTAVSSTSTYTATYTNNQATNAITTQWLELPYCYAFSGSPKLYLCSQDFASSFPNGTEMNTSASVNGGIGTTSNIISSFDVNNNYGNIITFNAVSPKPIPLSSPQPVTKVDFYFRLGSRTQYNDGTNTTITDYLQFQGQSFQLRLKFLVRRQAIQRSISDPTTGNKVMRMNAQLAGPQKAFNNDYIMRPSDVVQGGSRRMSQDPSRPKRRSYPTSMPMRQPF
jgi:hypothetical protein